MKVNNFFIIIAILGVAGCAHVTMSRPDNLRWSSGDISAEFPDGWVRLRKKKTLLCLSKDGLSLQRILVQRRGINKNLPRAKRKLSDDMLPLEVSRLIVDDLALNKKLGNLVIARNKPYWISGADAFLIEYLYRDKEFVPRRTLLIGFLKGKYYYEIKFQAVDQFYYQDGVDDFMKFVETVILL